MAQVSSSQLAKVVTESSFLSDPEKQAWLALLTKLPPEQLEPISQFFLQAHQKISLIHQQFAEQKSPLYQTLFDQLKHNLQKGRKVFWKDIEAQNQTQDTDRLEKIETAFSDPSLE